MPNSYLYITKAIDYYDLGADYGGSLAAAVEHVRCPFLVVSFSSDWLYTAEQARTLVGALEQTGHEVEYHHVDAPFGHDSFLVEVDRMEQVVGGFLTRLARSLLT